jgi:uncharacterized paraquat-inducible protein A
MTSACCPVCGSVRIVIVVSPRRRAFCASCGTRWMDEEEPALAAKPAGAVADPSYRKAP